MHLRASALVVWFAGVIWRVALSAWRVRCEVRALCLV